MAIKKLALIIFLSHAALSQIYAQSKAEVFNNNYRPAYHQSVTATQLNAMLLNKQAVVLDVRLEEDFQQNPVLIPGAQRVNPEKLSAWIEGNSTDNEVTVVVYCAGGKWVGQKAAYLINQAGVTVRNLKGGLNGWQATVPNGAP